jgi:hypothetical protein
MTKQSKRVSLKWPETLKKIRLSEQGAKLLGFAPKMLLLEVRRPSAVPACL